MLQAYLIDGQKANIEIISYLKSALNGNNPIIYSDTLQNGYSDITSIENWYTYGNNTGKDWKFIRNEIKTLMFSKAGSSLENYSNLNTNEKIIVAELFLVPEALRTPFFTSKQDYENSIRYNINSIKSRNNRYTSALSLFYLNLLKSDVNNIIKDLQSAVTTNVYANLIDNYIYYGIDGTRFDTDPGIFDYLESTVGTMYENEGLSSRITNMTAEQKQEFIDSVLDIMEFGNYDSSLINTDI
jgi:hypothetical protein